MTEAFYCADYRILLPQAQVRLFAADVSLHIRGVASGVTTG